MIYYDYEWRLTSEAILFDQELNINELGWKAGDCFKIKNIDGQSMLVKMEEVEQFVRGHK